MRRIENAGFARVQNSFPICRVRGSVQDGNNLVLSIKKVILFAVFSSVALDGFELLGFHVGQQLSDIGELGPFERVMLPATQH